MEEHDDAPTKQFCASVQMRFFSNHLTPYNIKTFWFIYTAKIRLKFEFGFKSSILC